MNKEKLIPGQIYQLSKWKNREALYLGKLSERKDVKAKHVLATRILGKTTIYRFNDNFELRNGTLTVHPYKCVIRDSEKEYIEGLISKL